MNQHNLFSLLGFVTTLATYGMGMMIILSVLNVDSKWKWLEGYIVVRILAGLIGGIVADRVGGKHVVGLGIIGMAILTLLISLSINQLDPCLLKVYGILAGLFEGLILPGLTALMSRCVPLEQRTVIGALVFGGTIFGMISTKTLLTFISCNYQISSLLYIIGTWGIVCYILWIVLAENIPVKNNFASEVEKGFQYQENISGSPVIKYWPSTPWQSILTSKSLWGLTIAQIGYEWGFYTIVQYLAMYLNFGKNQEDYISELYFYLCMWSMCFSISWFADWFIETDNASITAVRKLCVTIGMLIPAVCILFAYYGAAAYGRSMGISIFVLGFMFLGSGYSTLKVNALDLSPNHAGTIIGISNGLAMFMRQLVLPYVIENALEYDESLKTAGTFFWYSFIILIAANIVYLDIGSGNVQKWNGQARIRKE